MSPTAMAPKETVQVSWRIRNCTLRFNFGGFCLCSLELPMLDYSVPFHQLLGQASTPPPPSRLPQGVRSQRMRSYPTESRFPRISREKGHIRYVPRHYKRYYIEVEGSFSGYLAKFSSRTRSTLNRKLRRFARHSGGGIRWRKYTSPGEMPEFHRLAFEVSAKSYQGRLFGAGIPSADEFLQELHRRASAGEIRGFVLFLGDRPVAYNLSSVRGTAVEYDFPGFDPAFLDLSPGTVLLLLTLESIFDERRFSAFDFGPGELDYKRFFSTRCAPCVDIYYFPPTLANLTLVLVHSVVDVSANCCKKLLEFLKISDKFRKLIRYRLGLAVLVGWLCE